ncbi:MAG TPA: DUF2339 domain-containing protein [Armatimonadota bacterium]|jgi:uncharacterized membrane protein
MDDQLLILLGILLSICVLAGPVLGIIALVKISKMRGELNRELQLRQSMFRRVLEIENMLRGRLAETPSAPPQEAPPPAAPAPIISPPPVTPSSYQVMPEQMTYAAAVAATEPSVSAPAADKEIGRLEENLGKRWITWFGVLALFVSVALFVKLAIDNQWIGPSGRVIMGIIFGLALLIAGDRVIRREMRGLGEGLMGGGIAIIYVSLFAAFSLYHLIPAPLAFIAMLMLTALGIALAVLHNSLTINFLALLGGFLTPVMVSTGTNSRDALLVYLLLLDLGVLGVAYFKRWRAVDILAFAGTWILFAGWFASYYSAKQLIPTLCWMGAFYLVFLALPFIYHLRFRVPVTVERFMLALLNAAIVFSYAYYLLTPDYRFTLGFVALGISATTLLMGTLTRARLPKDSTAVFGFLALSVAFLTLAIPLQLKSHGVSLAWAVEGPVLLYLGYRFRYFPVRVGGLLVLLLAVIRLFTSYWPLHAEPFVPIINRHFLGAIAIPAINAAYAVIHYLWRREATRADKVMQLIAGIAAGFLALFIVQAELSLWLSFNNHDDLAHYLTAVLWAGGGLAFITIGVRLKQLSVMVAGTLPLLIGAIIGLSAYDISARYTLCANPRFFAIMLIALAVFLSWWQAYRQQVEVGYQQFLFGVFEIFLFLALSCETYTWGKSRHGSLALGANSSMEKAQWIAQMSLSITWGVYAIVLLAVGFWRRSRAMRLSALCLFGITAVKLLIIDMATLEQIYRILSFFVIGMLMIGASYLYHHIEKRLATSEGEHR